MGYLGVADQMRCKVGSRESPLCLIALSFLVLKEWVLKAADLPRCRADPGQ